jgi:hypothetical protein
MKSFLPVFSLYLLSTVFVCAQALEPRPNLPFSLRFPFETGAFMALRNEAPFRAVVTEKKVTDNSFSITLKRGETQTNTYQESGGSEDARKLVKYLVVGREYAFPAIFDKVLGPPKATATPGFPPTLPFPSSAMMGERLRLLDLPKRDPFRAKVTSKQLKSDQVTLELEPIDGNTLTLTQSGNVQMEEARRIAGLLEVGVLYEFPDAVLTSATKEMKSATEPSPEMRALAGFIGEWERPIAEPASGKSTLVYVWKKDGNGLWKELRIERSDLRKVVRSDWLITYDPERKCYVERATNPKVVPRETTMNWNAEMRTLSSSTESKHPQYGSIISSGKRTLTTPDRFESSAEVKNKEGEVVEKWSAVFSRVKR